MNLPVTDMWFSVTEVASGIFRITGTDGDVLVDSGLDTGPDADVPAYVETMRRLRDLPVKTVFGSHKDTMNRDRMHHIADRTIASR